MIDQLTAFIVDESKWLTTSMGLGLLALTILLYRSRHSHPPARIRIMAAMNLYFGVTIGTMAFGHLLAVTTKLALGTLRGSPSVFYVIGIVLAVPSWWLIHHARAVLIAGDDRGRMTLVLNAWLAITLLALGLPNLPLAAPAFLNVGYHLHSRRAVGWAFLSMAVVVNVGLFIGSLIYLASGQSFEQFSGMVPGGAEPPDAAVLVFRHAAVIDGTGRPPAFDQTVVVSGSRITAIGPSQAITIPRVARVVESEGLFMIPGLWDMHTHVFNQVSRRAPNEWYFPLMIAHGVTSIREMWTRPEDLPQIRAWRDRAETGSDVPRVVLAGVLIEGERPAWPNADTAATPQEGRERVRRARAAGLDFVKVYSTLRPDVFHAIADEARTLGIPIAGHVPIAMSPVEAAEAGMSSQEHLNEILESCSSRAETLRRIAWQDWSPAQDDLTVETFDRTRCAGVVAGLARTGTAHVPTLSHRAKLRLGSDWTPVLKDPRLEWVPQPSREKWIQHARRTEQDLRTSGRGAVHVTQFERAMWLTGELHRAGVRLMTGTDLGNPFVYPGSSVHDELELMVEAGLSPMDALMAGTSVPATFAGAADSLGTVEVGKVADVVLLQGNPLEDIANVRRIAGVVLNGRYLDSTQLTEWTGRSGR